MSESSKALALLKTVARNLGDMEARAYMMFGIERVMITA